MRVHKPSKPPFAQGDLDALCGAYSVVNVVRLMTQSDKRASKQVFYGTLAIMNKRKGSLQKHVLGGLRLKHIKAMLRLPEVGQHIEWHIPFASIATPTLDTFWESMLAHFQGEQPRAILLRLHGMHNHWTVIHRMDDETMYLYDSIHLKWIQRQHCMLTKDNMRMSHQLFPAQTIYIWEFL